MVDIRRLFAVLIGLAFIADYFARKRSAALEKLFKRLGYTFEAGPIDLEKLPFGKLNFFRQGHGHQRVFNLGRAQQADSQIIYCEYEYTTGSGKSRKSHHCSIFCKSGDFDFPEFTLQPEGIFSKIAQAAGYADIDFDSDPDFSKMFLLKGQNEARVRALFSPVLLRELKNYPKLQAEGGRGALVCKSPKVLKVERLEKWLSDCKNVSGYFKTN